MEGKDDAFSFLHTRNPPIAFSVLTCASGYCAGTGSTAMGPQGPAHVKANDSVDKETTHSP